ncbi:hypothetical protein BSUW23_18200 [Bacillus spizizenii str. W23]|uniref:Uncharacterized protein n=1 Tax=Bacillus spizizenii (strain ATCC 23059 / NRRL B-14472 / W23) TaxID=655816 RepID=E0TUQ5_BACSH|nr:hypothetical protein BSUW23_18200 [Bacillus spizizenii str. W23]
MEQNKKENPTKGFLFLSSYLLFGQFVYNYR